jgi:excisionase family DNA binding protein
MTNDRLMHTSEIAELLGVSRQSVSRWVREGRLKAIAISVGPRPVYRIRESDYRAFLNRYVRGED